MWLIQFSIWDTRSVVWASVGLLLVGGLIWQSRCEKGRLLKSRIGLLKVILGRGLEIVLTIGWSVLALNLAIGVILILALTK